MTGLEFSRPVKARRLPPAPLVLTADAEERAALAQRFGVIAVEALRAEVSLRPDKQAILAEGSLVADLVQTCGVSGEDFPVRIEETLALRFVPRAPPTEEEIELTAEECDEIEFEGESLDLGEAVAQSLGLAIDPYARGPSADAVRKQAGLLEQGASGPLGAALAALTKT